VFTTDFDGFESGTDSSQPFAISSAQISGDGIINSFNQQVVPVPFEFSPVVGLAMVGGLIAAKKLLKVKKAS